MSTDHKRPLLAFVLVAIACTVLIASTARSEAMRSYVQQGVSRVMAGSELAVDRERAIAAPAPAARPASFERGEAAPVTGSAAGASRTVPGRTLAPAPAAPKPRPHAHPARVRVAVAPPRVVPPVAAAVRAATTPHRPGTHRGVTHRAVAARAHRPITPPGLTRAPARHRAHAQPLRARASARAHGRPAHARGNARGHARAHLSARSARR